MVLELPALPPRPPRPGGTPGAMPVAGLAPNAALRGRLDLAPDLARFRIRPDAGAPAFLPGQYLSVGLPGPTGPVVRPYSIASVTDDRRAVELLIRRLDDGALTTRLWSLTPGDRLWVGPVKGRFQLDPDVATTAPHLFLAAGTGLAPVVAMLAALASMPSGRRPATALIHGATAVAELAYRDRLERWAADGWLRYQPTISRPVEVAASGWTGAAGRVETHVGRTVAEMGADPATLAAYLCGNDGMVAAGRAALTAAGVAAANMRWESFTPTRPAPRPA